VGDHHVDVSGASCLYCPFSEELDDAEINTWIHMVLTHEVDLNPGASPAPLREGVNYTRVSRLRPVLGYLHEFQFLNALMSLCMVSDVLTTHHRELPCSRTGHRNRKGRPGSPPGWWRGRGRRIPPPNPNPHMRMENWRGK
jgi:hypothetical protein